ncbi:MAG: DNA-protecting protein DprA [Gammaproteobacteria bacterium]|nr:MAG: DNA-protecting protein DprA [Gammaproteobacteria bacterium]
MDAILPDDARAWLTLNRVPGLGSRTLRRLLHCCPDPDALLSASDARLREFGVPTPARRALRRADRTAAAADLAWLTTPGRGLLTLACADYPAALLATADPPTLLFLEGQREALALPGIAVVGSRRPTATGLALARRFAGELADAGYAIVSGLAAGIDGAAHAGTLEVGGTTLAVLGNGPDRVYPRSHHGLAHAVAERGLLLSEYPPGTPPARHHFPRRNRVIAGLVLGVLVVEAAPRSGSLITARLAAEEGREVFAVPGSILNPLAQGCHALIRDGARLVEGLDDLLEELPPRAGAECRMPSRTGTGRQRTERDPADRALLSQLRAGPMSVDTLVMATSLGAGEVAARLLALELGGHVSSDSGGRFSLLPGAE